MCQSVCLKMSLTDILTEVPEGTQVNLPLIHMLKWTSTSMEFYNNFFLCQLFPIFSHSIKSNQQNF